MKMAIKFSVLLFCGLIMDIDSSENLKQVHVIFAHKLYAPMVNEPNVNPTSNLTFENFLSTMDMPNEAKMDIFNLGTYLRSRYDHFLGDVYTPESSYTRTSEFALSVISAFLVNAGLWPPAEIQTWNKDLLWQPVSTDSVSMEKDTLLLGSLCPNFQKDTADVLRQNDTQHLVAYHRILFHYIYKNSGILVNTTSSSALLYSYLETLTAYQKPLPSWANDIFPFGSMYNVTLLDYDLLSKTPLQKQLNGGSLLKRIINDSEKLAVTETSTEYHKIKIYSGEERNVIGVLQALDLWSPHILSEAASLIFEVYFNNVSNSYGIKTFYYTGKMDQLTIPLTLSNCTEVCPLNKFTEIVSDVLPLDEESLCGRRNSRNNTEIDANKEISNGSMVISPKEVIITLIVAVLSVCLVT